MANYQEVRVKLTNTKLKKLKYVFKKNRNNIKIKSVNKKNFEDEKFPHGLVLTTRQTTKTKNGFANNMSTDLKLSKAHISRKN